LNGKPPADPVSVRDITDVHERGICVFVFYQGGGSIFNTTISLMMMHDNKNGQLERTMSSRQQRQQGKYNGGKVGCLLR
jgi:hypothetical protein